MKAARPDLTVAPLRGNLDTRLRKLSEGLYEGLVVAGAGVKRLGRESEITEWLSPEVSLPAPAQGVLALVIRDCDEEWLRILEPLNDETSRLCAVAERSFLRALQGGCRVPVGALAEREGGRLVLTGLIADPTDAKVIRDKIEGLAAQPSDLGVQLAQLLLSRGAGEILKRYGRV